MSECEPCRAIKIAKAIVEDFKEPDFTMGEKEWVTVDTPTKRYVRKQVIELLVNEIIPKLKESRSKEARESGEILQDWLHKCDTGNTSACNISTNLLKSFLHRSEETRKTISCRASDDVFKIMDDLEPLVGIGKYEEIDKIVREAELKWCKSDERRDWTVNRGSKEEDQETIQRRSTRRLD